MNWFKALAEISTHDALLGMVNEYLLALPEDTWDWIPRDSRPRLVASIEELHGWHHKLAEDIGAATNPNVRMQDLCVFFMRASKRAIELEQARERGALANDAEFESHGNGCC